VLSSEGEDGEEGRSMMKSSSRVVARERRATRGSEGGAKGRRSSVRVLRRWVAELPGGARWKMVG
jgi:hypothetical protein